MSKPPSAPGLTHGIGVVFRMQLRRIVRGKKLRLGIIACSLVLVAVVAARYSSQRDVGAERSAELAAEAISAGFNWGYFKLLALLLPFLLTSSAIAEEIESRTFSYLTSRPVGRAAVTLGKYAAGVAVALALVVGTGLLLHVIGYASEPTAMVDEFGSTARALGALSLLLICYSAICMFWGAVVPEAAGIVSALYLAIIEFIGSFLPGYFRCISMNFLGREIADFPPGGWLVEMMPPPDVPVFIAAPVIAAVALLFLLFAVLTVRVSEYRFAQA